MKKYIIYLTGAQGSGKTVFSDQLRKGSEVELNPNVTRPAAKFTIQRNLEYHDVVIVSVQEHSLKLGLYLTEIADEIGAILIVSHITHGANG